MNFPGTNGQKIAGEQGAGADSCFYRDEFGTTAPPSYTLALNRTLRPRNHPGSTIIRFGNSFFCEVAGTWHFSNSPQASMHSR